MKKLLTSLAAVAAIGMSAPASAVVVGGIDFGAMGTAFNLNTATLAETFVNGVGQELRGYGYVTSVNGDTTYCADGTSNCALYFYFYGYTVSSFGGGKVQFTGGTVDMYYGNAPAMNFLTQNSNDNVAAITSLTKWTRFNGHTFADPLFGGVNATQTLNGSGTLTGASLSQSGAGLLDSNLSGTFGMASVANYMNGNSEADGLGGFADILLTSSTSNSILNPFDASSTLADSCKTASQQVGDWCLQGTLNTRGATNYTPEPAALSLVGLSLLAMGATARRRRKAA